MTARVQSPPRAELWNRFGTLEPVTASELLRDLTEPTEVTAQ
jgi:hypothetical protein